MLWHWDRLKFNWQTKEILFILTTTEDGESEWGENEDDKRKSNVYVSFFLHFYYEAKLFVIIYHSSYFFFISFSSCRRLRRKKNFKKKTWEKQTMRNCSSLSWVFETVIKWACESRSFSFVVHEWINGRILNSFEAKAGQVAILLVEHSKSYFRIADRFKMRFMRAQGQRRLKKVLMEAWGSFQY